MPNPFCRGPSYPYLCVGPRMRRMLTFSDHRGRPLLHFFPLLLQFSPQLFTLLCTSTPGLKLGGMIYTGMGGVLFPSTSNLWWLVCLRRRNSRASSTLFCWQSLMWASLSPGTLVITKVLAVHPRAWLSLARSGSASARGGACALVGVCLPTTGKKLGAAFLGPSYTPAPGWGSWRTLQYMAILPCVGL